MFCSICTCNRRIERFNVLQCTDILALVPVFAVCNLPAVETVNIDMFDFLKLSRKKYYTITIRYWDFFY